MFLQLGGLTWTSSPLSHSLWNVICCLDTSCGSLVMKLKLSICACKRSMEVKLYLKAGKGSLFDLLSSSIFIFLAFVSNFNASLNNNTFSSFLRCFIGENVNLSFSLRSLKPELFFLSLFIPFDTFVQCLNNRHKLTPFRNVIDDHRTTHLLKPRSRFGSRERNWNHEEC